METRRARMNGALSFLTSQQRSARHRLVKSRAVNPGQPAVSSLPAATSARQLRLTRPTPEGTHHHEERHHQDADRFRRCPAGHRLRQHLDLQRLTSPRRTRPSPLPPSRPPLPSPRPTPPLPAPRAPPTPRAARRAPPTRRCRLPRARRRAATRPTRRSTAPSSARWASKPDSISTDRRKTPR